MSGAQRTNANGHVLALVTILIWGTTFISTKVLLVDFEPVEILFIRFCMGFLALIVICPRFLRGTSWRQELTFAGAGLCGICLYYLLENIALTYTLASNVGIICSTAPFFTALLSRLFLHGEERLRPSFFAGFAIAMIGIALISLNGASLEVNPRGDALALLAAFIWACYSVLTRKIAAFGYGTVQTTQRVFFYGILFMIPALFIFGFELDISRFVSPVNALNLLFLGLGASALCFVTWNHAVKLLGALKTSAYIYLAPAITVVASAIILHEPVTWATVAGLALTLAGLVLSEGLPRKKR